LKARSGLDVLWRVAYKSHCPSIRIPILHGALNEDTLDDGWVRPAIAVHLLGFINSGEQILAILIYCVSSDMGQNRFGKRAKVYPGKAPLREIFQAEVAGEHIEKKPVDNIDWDTETIIEGKLESVGQSGRDCQLLVIVSGKCCKCRYFDSLSSSMKTSLV